MCPEPTVLLLIGCLTKLFWIPKIQIKYVDTKIKTCRHSNQREFHAWRLEPSSVFVQHNEFLDVLLQPTRQFSFWSDRKAERHVKRGQETTSSGVSLMGEGETSQLGYTLPVEREGKSSAGFGASSLSVERRWRTRWSYKYMETWTN